MAIQPAVLNGMLTTISGAFDTIYLLEAPLLNVLPGDAISAHTSKVIDSAKTLTWGTAASGSITTTNSATSNPINYSVPQNKAPNLLALVDSGIIRGVIVIPAPLPTYTAGDGGYYLRGITLELTEV